MIKDAYIKEYRDALLHAVGNQDDDSIAVLINKIYDDGYHDAYERMSK